MLDFTAFPHFGCHLLAVAVGFNGKESAREWIHGQARGGVRDPERFRNDLFGGNGIISAQLFHRVGDCRLPLYIAPRMAKELLDLRFIAPERPIQANEWKMRFSHAGRR